MGQETSNTTVTQQDKGLPVITQAPPKEVALPPSVAAKTFSLDDFEVEQLPEQKPAEGVTKATTEVTPTKVEDSKPVGELETPVEEAPKEEAPKAKTLLDKVLKKPGSEKGAGTETQKAAEGTTKPIVPSKSTRDYTSYSPEEVTALKGMSNEGFALATKAIRENRELAKLKDSNYLQHEQAYVLDPQYQSLRSDVSYAQREAAYWQSQLVNMDAGKPCVPLTGWDTATGKPVFGAEIPASKALEEQVRMLMNNSYGQVNQLQAKLQEIPKKYQERVKGDLANIEAYRAKEFGWNNDPSLLDYTVNIEGLGERSLKQIKEDVSSILPPYMRSHPLSAVMGDLVIALKIQAAELSQYKGQEAVQAIKDAETKRVEPSTREKPAATNYEKVHGVSKFEIDESVFQ